MSAAEVAKTLTGQPCPNGDPSTWVYLVDLPTPPEVAREVEEERHRNGWWWRWWWKRLIDSKRQHLKLLHYFAGKRIIFKETSRGPLLLFVADARSPEIDVFLERVPQEDREHIHVQTVYDGDYPDWVHI